MKEPKILLWDVENTHNIVATFGMWNVNIFHENILQEWFMVCASWKWLGDKNVTAVSLLDDPVRFRADHTDDYYVIACIHEVLMEADAIVAHNGDQFDLKKFNARAIKHGLSPVPPMVQIDTLKIAKAKFRFNFNKLDYLGHYLGVGQKINTDNQLWLDCLSGKRKAIREMVKYNIEDVNLLERVYNKLAPFIDTKLNRNHFNVGERPVCPQCGEDSLQKRGFRLTRVARHQRFQCNDCGNWSSAPIKRDGSFGQVR